jgi:hypothetical protein
MDGWPVGGFPTARSVSEDGRVPQGQDPLLIKSLQQIKKVRCPT